MFLQTKGLQGAFCPLNMRNNYRKRKLIPVKFIFEWTLLVVFNSTQCWFSTCPKQFTVISLSKKLHFSSVPVVKFPEKTASSVTSICFCGERDAQMFQLSVVGAVVLSFYIHNTQGYSLVTTKPLHCCFNCQTAFIIIYICVLQCGFKLKALVINTTLLCILCYISSLQRL